MFSIGIKSGIITLLGLIACSLVIQITGLQSAIIQYLPCIVLLLGIYSAQYYYKYANNGQITYIEGVKVGTITVLITSLMISGLIYLIALQYGNKFTSILIKELNNITTKGYNANSLMEPQIVLRMHYLQVPKILLLMTFKIFSIIGFLFTLFLAFFSKTNSH